MALRRKEIRFETAFASYRVQTILGKGGSGRVYKVSDENDREYALKCLDPKKATTDKLKRFKNELFFCLRNTPKNIITVLDYGLATIEGTTCPFYVMPYYLSTLRELIKKTFPAIRYSCTSHRFSMALKQPIYSPFGIGI